MGVIYAVVCRDCNVKRNVDKLRVPVLSGRADALKEWDVAHTFRPFLLASFMVEHYMHDCFLVDDTRNEDLFDEYPDEPKNFWDFT